MATSTLLTLTSHSLLSNKCRSCIRRRSPTCLSSKWMSEVFSMMTVLLMLSSTRELSILSSVEMVQVQTPIKCLQKSTDASHQLVSTSVLHTAFLNKEWAISRSQNSIGQSSSIRSPSPLSQLLQLSLMRIRMRKTSTISIS